VIGIVLGINTERTAYTGSLSGRTDTFARDTGLSAGAFDATVATIVVVGLGIDTTATAFFWCACWATRDAKRVGAQLTRCTLFIAFTAMVAIGFGVDAFVDRRTKNLATQTLAFAIDT
jgi:hypothetical protein